MISELKLNIYELLVYAFLYGFKNGFEGSIQYIADSTCMSNREARRALNNLSEKGIVKKEYRKGKTNKYSAVQQTAHHGTTDRTTTARQTANNNKHITNNKKGTFNDFEQRVYNFSELEKILRSN